MSTKKPDPSQAQYLTASRMSGMGLELVGAIGTMAVIGWLLDRWLGTDPWLVMSGLLLGLVAGMYRFFKTALSVTRSDREGSDDAGSGSD